MYWGELTWIQRENEAGEVTRESQLPLTIPKVPCLAPEVIVSIFPSLLWSKVYIFWSFFSCVSFFLVILVSLFIHLSTNNHEVPSIYEALCSVLRYNNEQENQSSCPHTGIQEVFSGWGWNKVRNETRNDVYLKQKEVCPVSMPWWDSSGLPWEYAAAAPHLDLWSVPEEQWELSLEGEWVLPQVRETRGSCVFGREKCWEAQ